MTKLRKKFIDKEQELSWKAFKGDCGREFAGNPVFMENYMEKERAFENERTFDKQGMER